MDPYFSGILSIHGSHCWKVKDPPIKPKQQRICTIKTWVNSQNFWFRRMRWRWILKCWRHWAGRIKMGWVFPTEERLQISYSYGKGPFSWMISWNMAIFPRYVRLPEGKQPKADCTNKTTRISKINRWTFVDMGMSGMYKMFLHPNRQIDYLFGSKMVQATSNKMGFGSNSKLPPSLDTAHECLLFFGLSWIKLWWSNLTAQRFWSTEMHPWNAVLQSLKLVVSE